MSKRLQDLYDTYTRRKIEIENNEKIIKDVTSSLKAMKESLSPKVIEVINQYDHNLLDMIDVDKFSDLSKIEEFKKTLNYIIDTMFNAMESDLG